MLNAIKVMHFVKSEENQNIRGPSVSEAHVETFEVFMCPRGVCCV